MFNFGNRKKNTTRRKKPPKKEWWKGRPGVGWRKALRHQVMAEGLGWTLASIWAGGTTRNRATGYQPTLQLSPWLLSLPTASRQPKPIPPHHCPRPHLRPHPRPRPQHICIKKTR